MASTPQKPSSFSLTVMTCSFMEGFMTVLMIAFSLISFLMRGIFSYAWSFLPSRKPEVVTKLHADWMAQTANDLTNLAAQSIIETRNRHSEIAQLRTRTESEIDTLRDEIKQMHTEMATLKSSIIILRRAL